MKWIRKVFLILIVTFAAFYLITRPEDAAAAVRGAFEAVGGAGGSIVKFFTSLAG